MDRWKSSRFCQALSRRDDVAAVGWTTAAGWRPTSHHGSKKLWPMKMWKSATKQSFRRLLWRLDQVEHALPYTLEELARNGLMTSSRCECFTALLFSSDASNFPLFHISRQTRMRTRWCLTQLMVRLRHATVGSGRARPFESVKSFSHVATSCNGQRVADFWQGLALDERWCLEDGPETKQFG